MTQQVSSGESLRNAPDRTNSNFARTNFAQPPAAGSQQQSTRERWRALGCLPLEALGHLERMITVDGMIFCLCWRELAIGVLWQTGPVRRCSRRLHTAQC